MDRTFDAVIPAYVRYNKELNANEKLLYAEIRALCDERGYCWASNEYFAELFDTSDSSIKRWISNLKNHGFIDVDIKFAPSPSPLKRRTIRLAGIHEVKNEPYNTRLTSEPLNNNISITNNSNKDIEIIKEIVDYLNTKTGAKYKHSTPSTQKHIRARLSEKYTVDDFKTVIDKKVMEWKGTDMEKYLCPDTLFSTKFEKYLNQNIRQQANKPMLDSRWTGGIGN
jgi:uncharacterized phage protein (TIGR02220 family)